MTGTSRRTTTLAICTALAAGLAAAWLISGYTSSLDRRAGTPVTVLVAESAIAGGTALDDPASPIKVVSRQIPKSYAPVGAVQRQDQLSAMRAAVDLPPGSYITNSALVPISGATGYRLRKNERAISLSAVFAADQSNPVVGQRVDLLASGIGGSTATTVILRAAELLTVADPDDSAPDAKASATRRITIRVTLRQARVVVRAAVFAKEVRVLMRP